MTASLQPRDLFTQHLGIAAIPAVGDEQHDRPAAQRAPHPLLMELANRRADPGAARPVRDSPGDRADRFADAPGAQLHGDAGELGREQKRLDASLPPRERVREVQQHARVAFHRSADVAQEDDGPRTDAPRPPRQREDVAAGTQTARDRAPQIDARSASANPSPGPALARTPHQPIERQPRPHDLVGAELPEVLVGQRTDIAPCLQQCGRRGALVWRIDVACWRPFAVTLTTAVLVRRPRRTLHVRAASRVHAPEHVERAIEHRELIVAMHQQRPAGVIDLVARRQVHVLQRLRDVDHAADVHVDAAAPKQPAEDDQIALKVGHARSHCRSRMPDEKNEGGQREERWGRPSARRSLRSSPWATVIGRVTRPSGRARCPSSVSMM